jgi:hypothetical protein
MKKRITSLIDWANSFSDLDLLTLLVIELVVGLSVLYGRAGW